MRFLQIIQKSAFLLLFVSFYASAANPPASVTKADAEAFGTSLLGGATNVIANPDTTIEPNYTANPPQTSYFADPTLMPADATVEMQTNSAGTFLNESMQTRPQIPIDPINDPLVIKSNQIIEDPNAAANSVLNNNCWTEKTIGTCVPTFTQQTCDEILARENITCNKTLTVDVKVNEYLSCTPFTWFKASLSTNTIFRITNTIDKNGDLVSSTNETVPLIYYAEVLCDPYRTDNNLLIRTRGYSSLRPATCGAPAWFQNTISRAGVSNLYLARKGQEVYNGYGCNEFAFVTYATGSCTATDCTYAIRFDFLGWITTDNDGSVTDARWQLTDSNTVNLTFPNPVSKITYTTTDTIDDKCVPLEARL